MLKTTSTHLVSKDTYFDEIFPDGIATNTFYNKGRCAIGATRSEIKNRTRSSIIVVSNIGIIKNKCKSNPAIFGVWGEVDQLDVNIRIDQCNNAEKIMCTPESLSKVVNAFKGDRLVELYKSWFLLLDEAHTYCSEDYRKDILKPFEYFWSFKNKAMISATPYLFSNPKFKDLHYVNIMFTEPLGTINLIECVSIPGTLDYILKAKVNDGEHFHIFYNSVTDIVKAIKRAGINNYNIYCAGNITNKKTMGGMVSHYVEEPDTTNFNTFNFYTTRYFEGWDMFDENANIILVTDINSGNTIVSVDMKLKQAAGRLRNSPKAIYHLTNHRHIPERKTLNEFKAYDAERAPLLIASYNQQIDFSTSKGMKPDLDPRIKHIANIDKTTKKATLNLEMLDQHTHEAASNETFNHIQYIKQEWEDAYFKVVTNHSSYRVDTGSNIKRRSKADTLKEDYLSLEEYKNQTDLVFYFINPIDNVRELNPLAFEASLFINKDKMEELKWNVKAVKAAVIIASNMNQKNKLLKLLDQTFAVGKPYTIESIRTKLTEFYSILEIKDAKGNIKVAEATDLRNDGWYEIKSCKIKDKHNNKVNGFTLIRKTFEMRLAA